MNSEYSSDPKVLDFPIPRMFETDAEKLSRLELENKQLVEELAVERVMSSAGTIQKVSNK